MTRFLADTNVIYRAWYDVDRLIPDQSRILGSDATVFASIASVWELSIKAGLGKVRVPDDIATTLIETGFHLLPILPAHAEAVRELPLHHRDPFDRLLIAQAQLEGLTILTADRHFASYDVAVI